MRPCVGDSVDVVFFCKVGRHPEAFDAALVQDFPADDQRAFGDGLVERLAHGVDPEFRRHVRLPFGAHGGEGWHGIAGDEFDRAAVAVFQNDLVDPGNRTGRRPVHFRNGDRAALFCHGGRGHADESGRGDRDKQLLHEDAPVQSVCLRLNWVRRAKASVKAITSLRIQWERIMSCEHKFAVKAFRLILINSAFN